MAVLRLARDARPYIVCPVLLFTSSPTTTSTNWLCNLSYQLLQLDEINQLFLPNMRNKLLWFYQEVDEPEPPPVADNPKPGPSRAGGVSTISKTPQGLCSTFCPSLRGGNYNLKHTHSSYTGTSSSGPTKQHKLFLTDGWDCGFTGICIYIFRINNSKQLPEEGFHKDLWVIQRSWVDCIHTSAMHN